MLSLLIKNKIHTKINDTSIQKNRFIGQFKGSSNGPTLIFVAGMHGNEPAGIFALRDVLKALNSLKDKFQGNLYALSGNLSALEKGIRYNEHDLNRLWTSEIIDDIEKHKSLASANEIIELKDIYYSIDQILKKEKGPFYFFDLHTTSSHSIPFITVNDSLLNRKYTSQYPLPIVLGIEEFLNGALLNYINELGYIAFGFEGGQHEDPIAVDNHIAFIYLSMVFSGSLKKDEINFKKYYDQLFNSTEKHQSFYEIFQRY